MNSGNFSEIVLIGVCLSLDAFALSVAGGLTIKTLRVQHAFRVAAIFGGFQALMPVLGWYFGLTLLDSFSRYNHWIAFGLLSFVGGKMVYESFQLQPDRTPFTLRFTTLLLLAIATSIDAFAVGMTYSVLGVEIWQAAAIIGIVTFVICLLGFAISTRFGHIFENKMEIIGGLVLIAIGVKILIEGRVL